uniref:Uncharacterized protein n=1 Tax=Panagrellus redivivus TaxID=6233 RepID=A0A7E4ZXJ2_PANRE
MSTDDGGDFATPNSLKVSKEITSLKKPNDPSAPDAQKGPNASKLSTLIAVNRPKVPDVPVQSHKSVPRQPGRSSDNDQSVFDNLNEMKHNANLNGGQGQTASQTPIPMVKPGSINCTDCLIAVAERDRCLMPPPPLPCMKRETLRKTDSVKVTSAASSSESTSPKKLMISVKRTADSKSAAPTVKKMRNDK